MKLEFMLIQSCMCTKFYLKLGLLGFFVSWEFGACYSWIAQKGDITGRLAPLFLVSCNVPLPRSALELKKLSTFIEN